VEGLYEVADRRAMQNTGLGEYALARWEMDGGSARTSILDRVYQESESTQQDARYKFGMV
jgi:hypothetical protein